MNWQDRIERNPEIMLGKPVIKGTRITVELILERLGDGWSHEDILKSFPHLTSDDILAACSYGAVALSSDDMVIYGGHR